MADQSHTIKKAILEASALTDCQRSDRLQLLELLQKSTLLLESLKQRICTMLPYCDDELVGKLLHALEGAQSIPSIGEEELLGYEALVRVLGKETSAATDIATAESALDAQP